MTSNAVKRIINKDMKELRKMDLESSGIFIQFEEENILNAKAIIIGPKNTPYENGVLYFTIEFPSSYPFSPPKINYISGSRHRIHPNLYVGRSRDKYLGKVCLSILNTWSGPKWTTVMHIGSILLSIQSLLDENPLHNEPGFENEIGGRNDTYNEIVLYDTFHNLILRNCLNINPSFQCFEENIKDHLSKEFYAINTKLDELCKIYPQKLKISLNIYGLYIIFDYPSLKNLINS